MKKTISTILIIFMMCGAGIADQLKWETMPDREKVIVLEMQRDYFKEKAEDNAVSKETTMYMLASFAIGVFTAYLMAQGGNHEQHY